MRIFFIFVLPTVLFSQSTPEAKKILDKLSAYYDGLSQLEVSFELTIDLAEQDPEIQNGKILKSGQKFFISLGQQEFLNDGASIYSIFHPSKEIQLSAANEADETFGISPSNMFDFYKKNDFEYAVTQTKAEQKLIEFKPLDKWSDYSKLRMTVNHVSNRILKLEAFFKDGAVYILNIKNLNPNPSFTPSTFAFNKEKYKSYQLIDLR
jgi:outer membrane lipoprotein carrier protein